MGIGTTNLGTHELAVGGSIHAEEIVVETGWADFVFEDDYQLRPLGEVAAYIDQHGRLPEVPSAAEVAAKGVPLGEAQTVLLQKIEELTLYILELDRELRALKESLAVDRGTLEVLR